MKEDTKLPLPYERKKWGVFLWVLFLPLRPIDREDDLAEEVIRRGIIENPVKINKSVVIEFSRH